MDHNFYLELVRKYGPAEESLEKELTMNGTHFYGPATTTRDEMVEFAKSFAGNKACTCDNSNKKLVVWGGRFHEICEDCYKPIIETFSTETLKWLWDFYGGEL